MIRLALRRYPCVILALAAVAVVGHAFSNVAVATLIAYEPFNYAPGDAINGKSGGVGWSAPWSSPRPASNGPQGGAPAGSNFVVAGSLTGPAGLTTVGNRARFTGEFGTVDGLHRPFPNIAGTAGTTTWVSFLAQRLGAPTDPLVTPGSNWVNNLYPRGANVGLFDTQAAAQGGTNHERIAIGNSTTNNGVDANHYDEWSLIPQGAGAAREGPVSHLPKWSQLAWGVMRIDHVGDATVSDTTYLWLNPDPLGGEPLIGNADVTIISGDTNARDLSDLDFIRPFVGNNQTGANGRPFAVMDVDEIRIGTTWADMRNTAGIPEPTSCVLLLLGGIALCGRRHR